MNKFFKTKTIRAKIIDYKYIIHAKNHCGYKIIVEDEMGNKRKLILDNDVLDRCMPYQKYFPMQKYNYGEFSYLGIFRYVVSVKLYKNKG